MWGTFWRTLGRRISLIFMAADLLLPDYPIAVRYRTHGDATIERLAPVTDQLTPVEHWYFAQVVLI